MPGSALAIEYVIVGPLPRCQQVCIDSLSCLLGDLKFYRAASLTLANGGSIIGVTLRRDIFNLQAYDITATQFAIYGKIEESKISFSTGQLQASSNCPDMSWFQRWFWPNDPTLIPWMPVVVSENGLV